MPWFRRSPKQLDGTVVALPAAWRYGAPTSDNSSGSTTLTAAATIVTAPGQTTRKVKRPKTALDTAWQEEAWSMYDQVGELRYVSNAIAGRMGQAELYVEKNGERVETDDPVLELITPQMVERLGLNLFVAGGGWLAGLPSEDLPDDAEGASTTDKVEWMVLSTIEVKEPRGNAAVEIREKKYKQDEIFLVRIWDPHPARWKEADSPVRSSLPILRELVGLTQHVSAQIDSRLAGAGVYWIPNSILQSAKVPETTGTMQTFSNNAVLNAIMNAMLLPMEDRSNASAVVPLLMGAQDDAIAKIRFDDFSTPFDKNTGALREEAIRRLGLSLDAPPELLQGMGDANHWGMWLVRDEVIQTHVSPRLDLIADALTTGFYRPVMKQLGDPDPDAYVLKFDVSHLVQRPNRLADASNLHDKGAIGDKALREAGGFEESDAPSSQDIAIRLALEVAQANPQLLDNMPDIVKAIMAVLDGTPATGPDVVQSTREPGSLRPLVPANKGIAPVPINGKEAPLVDAEAAPAAGPPV